ncbi:hypothetical protein ELE36_07020 [Pseudolysobacter antarcticus]|uniref:YncE family protein n=1 Tax=Pseudolysobacter antarcticus TaxID=2511995 RepID=A0A411HHZ1_9GAMM|nr:hypothetical protein [Pseudolysobacter antarcticus]QBB70136.1 hypothetical protein ELE36_07020 [Pseudolysobacter antarcticus]
MNSAAGATWLTHSVDIGGVPVALRVDAKRERIYLSVPGSNRVFFVDLHTLEVQRQVYVGFHPTGMDLSHDGDTLYTALNQAGAIGVYDLTTDVGYEFDISLPLGDSRTYDVAEVSPGIVFASASPCGGGFAYVVRADIHAATATRVADQNIIRCSPAFAVDPVGASLFVSNYEFPSIQAFDTSQVSAPVSSYLQPGTGPSIHAGLGLAINPTGDRLSFTDGTVIQTQNYSSVGDIHAGPSVFSADGSYLVSAFGAMPVIIYRHNAMNLAAVDEIESTCDPFNGSEMPTAIRNLPGQVGWAFISGSWLCTLQLIPDGIFLDSFDH